MNRGPRKRIYVNANDEVFRQLCIAARLEGITLAEYLKQALILRNEASRDLPDSIRTRLAARLRQLDTTPPWKLDRESSD
jgi:hypothetical protein